MNSLLKNTLISKIIEKQKIVSEQSVQLKKLKCYAEAQAKLAVKKKKLLEEGIVKNYDISERQSVIIKDLNLWC